MHDLEALLDATRAALLAGDLEELARLATALEVALDSRALSPEEAMALRARAVHNATLLAAASSGVRSARRRMAEVAASRDLVTYDSTGRRGVVQARAGVPVRRA